MCTTCVIFVSCAVGTWSAADATSCSACINKPSVNAHYTTNGTATDNVVAEKNTNAGSYALPAQNAYIFTFSDENSMTAKTYEDGAAFAFIAITKDSQGKDY